MEWVEYDRGHSVELVRRREKDCWEWLFRGKTLDFIVRKLSNLLPLNQKAVLLPSKADCVLFANPHRPEEMALALQQLFERERALWDVVLTAHAWRAPLELPVRTDQTKRIMLTKKDEACFDVLFQKKNLDFIAAKLNAVWLPDDVRIFFPAAWKEAIVVHRKDLAGAISQAKDLLSRIGSRYDIGLACKEETARFPFMKAV